MSEQKEKRLLSQDLPLAQRALILQTTQTPGWKLIVKMANDAVIQFRDDIVRVDPEKPDAAHVLAERHRRARVASEAYDLLMASIHTLADSVVRASRKEDEQAVESVGAMFGIHPAQKKGTKAEDAIKNIFGIHPAKPKKKLPPEGK